MGRICALVIALVLLIATPGIASADAYTRTPNNQQAVNLVIARGLSQRGVPFTYGGGNASGPTRGTAPTTPAAVPDPLAPAAVPDPLAPVPLTPATVPDPRADVVGFDASGLIVYAFAGVGVKLPRSSGEQYKVGRKVVPSQALPGDLIFYGPDGTQSVALFMGNGQMLETTDSGVAVSAVRTAGMTPYLVRIIA